MSLTESTLDGPGESGSLASLSEVFLTSDWALHRSLLIALATMGHMRCGGFRRIIRSAPRCCTVAVTASVTRGFLMPLLRLAWIERAKFRFRDSTKPRLFGSKKGNLDVSWRRYSKHKRQLFPLSMDRLDGNDVTSSEVPF